MIYFLLENGPGGLVKIGFTSTCAEDRRAGCQIGNPRVLKVIAEFPGSFGDEAALHKTFKVHHVHGEWFHAAPEIMQFAASKNDAPKQRFRIEINTEASTSSKKEATTYKYHDALQQHKKDIVLQTLAACDNNKAEAARKLGLTREGLYGVLRKLGWQASNSASRMRRDAGRVGSVARWKHRKP